MKSPKTTIVAVCMVLSGLSSIVIGFAGGDPTMGTFEALTLIITGIGFFFARDADRTDREAGAVEAEEHRASKKIFRTSKPRSK